MSIYSHFKRSLSCTVAVSATLLILGGCTTKNSVFNKLTGRPTLPQQQMIEESSQYNAQFSQRRRPINNPPAGASPRYRMGGAQTMPMQPPQAYPAATPLPQGMMPQGYPGSDMMQAMQPPFSGGSTPPGMPEIEGDSPLYPGGGDIETMGVSGPLFPTMPGQGSAAQNMQQGYPGGGMPYAPSGGNPMMAQGNTAMPAMMPMMQLDGDTPPGGAMPFPDQPSPSAPYNGMRNAAESRY